MQHYVQIRFSNARICMCIVFLFHFVVSTKGLQIMPSKCCLLRMQLMQSCTNYAFNQMQFNNSASKANLENQLLFSLRLHNIISKIA